MPTPLWAVRIPTKQLYALFKFLCHARSASIHTNKSLVCCALFGRILQPLASAPSLRTIDAILYSYLFTEFSCIHLLDAVAFDHKMSSNHNGSSLTDDQIHGIMDRILLIALDDFETGPSTLSKPAVANILLQDSLIDLETEQMTFSRALFNLVNTYLDSESPQHSAGDIVASLLETSCAWAEGENRFRNSMAEIAGGMVQCLPEEVPRFVDSLFGDTEEASR